MSKLILTRHGQSIWNAENRFTGWVDVDLSEKGVKEAEKSGELIKKLNIKIDISYIKIAVFDSQCHTFTLSWFTITKWN